MIPVIAAGPDDRTLHLLRHAKSSWDDPSLADADRPLAPRGQRAATRIARHLRERWDAPDLVVCSPALRTRQTLKLVAAGFDGDPEIAIDERLYGTGSAELLARLREVAPAVATVMLIGHQPAIGELALSLAGTGPGLEQLGGKFPTAALATFAVPAWPELGPGSGRLLEMVRPKQLPN